ncbi:hypothetical protein KP509_12G031700 [Ceratopteris richardii]|uniref:DUF7750 domain-containing protein n=1 Tax=Ceratopteris richardii TaxID=49495 RepID=A0A8T2TJU8_CERRI|nr:hypothetical protein KP509_12G031700 [Ceratopteris richardii]
MSLTVSSNGRSGLCICLPHVHGPFCRDHVRGCCNFRCSNFPLKKVLWMTNRRTWKTKLLPTWIPSFKHKRRTLPPIRASSTFESNVQVLSQFMQHLASFFRSEDGPSDELNRQSGSGYLYLQNALEGFLNHVPFDLFIASVALVVGSMSGYIVAGKLHEEVSDLTELATEWLLIMNATAFNRFVLMRCPSIKFKYVDVYEGLSKRLTAEEHHVVTLNISYGELNYGNATNDSDFYSLKEDGGRIGHGASEGKALRESAIKQYMPSYQRIFLHADDGGILAIDWPSHLELSGEHGLDTIILLIPGSFEGSRGKIIRDFVRRCIQSGYFPIVLNPRGCGGSQLTTPRLFTAGDSDDVRMTVDYILRSRPWSSVMAVGWGYGADMLVKYLGEEASSAPITAAVCIDNTFDLEEINKFSFDQHTDLFNQNMRNSYVEILKANQMIFEGRGKDFDLQKGLSAKTIRDFDEAISSVSKGYSNVTDMYKECSSKSWIDNVKIPILCLQDSGSVGRTFTIPRHIFQENPFTTLLLMLTQREEPFSQMSATKYYDSLVLEWLSAVELAFLRGRHPLLKGIDAFKFPLKERPLSQQTQIYHDVGNSLARTKNNPTVINGREDNYMNYLATAYQRFEGSTMGYNDNTRQDLSQNVGGKLLANSKICINSDSQDAHNVDLANEKEYQDCNDEDASNSDDSELEQGQVRQAAESVLKVLDVTMPGTLSEKKKEEVLEAVGRGASIVSALQEACPEDVREKMITAVSAAVQARGISLKLAGFGKNMPAPKIPAGMVENIQKKLSSLVHNKPSNTSMEETSRVMRSNPVAATGNGDPGTVPNPNEGPEKAAQEPYANKEPERSASVASSSQTDNGATNELTGKADMNMDQIQTSEKVRQDNAITGREKVHDDTGPVSDDDKINEVGTNQTEKLGDSTSQEQQKPNGQEQKQENEGVTSQRNEPQTEKRNGTSADSGGGDQAKRIPEQNLDIPSSMTAPLPSIDISRAFDAFTGVDDSTQMAVTNVFGVIENVLEQLEKEQNQKDEQVECELSNEQLEQGKDDQLQHSSVSNQNSTNENDTGTDIQSIVGDKVNEGSLCQDGGLFEVNCVEHSSEKDTDELNVELDESEETETGKRNNENSTVYIPDLSIHSPRSDRDSSSDQDEDFDDGNLALEYFEDENIWKLTDDDSGTNRASQIQRNADFQSPNLDKLTDLEKNRVTSQLCIAVDEEVKPLKVNGLFFNEAVDHGDSNLSEFLSENFNPQLSPHRHTDIVYYLKNEISGLIIDALELELLRKLGKSNVQLLGSALKCDIEAIGLTVAETIGKHLSACMEEGVDVEMPKSLREVAGKGYKLHVDTIVSSVNKEYGNLSILSSVMPAGMLFGIVLAALNPLGIMSTYDVEGGEKSAQIKRERTSSQIGLPVSQRNSDPKLFDKIHKRSVDSSSSQSVATSHERSGEGINSSNGNISSDIYNENNNVLSGVDREPASAGETTPVNAVMGAMTVALGATAALAGHESVKSMEQIHEGECSEAISDGAIRNIEAGADAQLDKVEGKGSIVSTLAERAMSVAAPVVPMKQDGGVDHERLVEILANLSQRGGILRLIGKAALLWGGLRGAMSLTDRLLVFLHIMDRPLYQRIAGFLVMVLLIWSPVLVPLLPSLLQQWASQSHNTFATTAAIIGLYCAVVILINIWGKKIRGYEDALYQYGVTLHPGVNTVQLHRSFKYL